MAASMRFGEGERLWGGCSPSTGAISCPVSSRFPQPQRSCVPGEGSCRKELGKKEEGNVEIRMGRIQGTAGLKELL